MKILEKSSIIPFNRPWQSTREEELVVQSLASGKLCGDGPFTRTAREMLEKLTGAPAALLTTSCTSALELAALLLEVGPGDEVILPSFTFVSTANPFCLRGATPVFVDINPQTMNMDPTQVASLVTDRTRVVVPVHYAGLGCDLDPILALASARGFHVVEDAAQAVGSTRNGKVLGTEGTFGTYSFHDTKNITCGEGGALLINDPAFVERALVLREKGTNRSQFLRGMVDKYTWVDAGSSFLPSDLLAALLVAQLEDLELITSHRRRIWNSYHDELADLHVQGKIFLPQKSLFDESNGHMFWLRCADLDERTRLIAFLKGRDITAPFHYVPLHLSPLGRRYGGREGQLPHTEALADRLVRLPLWAGLSQDEAFRITNSVKEFYLG